MDTYTKRLVRALEAEVEQEAWIAECGGDLAGYVKRYGSAADPDHYGDGGEAIYAADVAQLARLRDVKRALIDRAQQFGRPPKPKYTPGFDGKGKLILHTDPQKHAFGTYGLHIHPEGGDGTPIYI